MIYFSFSLDEVLKSIRAEVNNEKDFLVVVPRLQPVERGLAQWKRQKKSGPTNQLRVQFIGEAGVDTGGIRKEFLTGTYKQGARLTFSTRSTEIVG